MSSDPVIRTVAQTASTNADMLALAREGLGEGIWLRAEQQSGGRGRQGRHWVSPPGNFYGSTLVRLRPTDPPAASLALVSAVALEEAVSTWLPGRARIKWPNDLLVDGAKLSGVLLERAEDAVVIGIGVNLAHHPDLPDRPTTSLAAHGCTVAPADFADALAASLARWLSRWRGEGLGPIRARWLDRSLPLGTALSAQLPGGDAVEGLFVGLDGDGAMILRLADGTTHAIHAGDVFLI